jgi:hypothetical protein
MNIFHRPTPVEVAARELGEAQLALLAAQSGLEYAKAMVQYHEARIARLEEYVK